MLMPFPAKPASRIFSYRWRCEDLESAPLGAILIPSWPAVPVPIAWKPVRITSAESTVAGWENAGDPTVTLVEFKTVAWSPAPTTRTLSRKTKSVNVELKGADHEE